MSAGTSSATESLYDSPTTPAEACNDESELAGARILKSSGGFLDPGHGLFIYLFAQTSR